MKLSYKSIVYDIENLAYAIADTGEAGRHTLHRVRDICQDGNIDRVARILGLAYSNILTVLLPVLSPPRFNPDKDQSATPHDYNLKLREDASLKYMLTKERKLKIKETSHEYMVAMALADWLGITLPEAADVWKFRAETALDSLKELVSSVIASSFSASLTRKISPL